MDRCKEERFNSYKLYQIVKQIKYNPYYAKEELESYLSLYHTDFLAYCHYIQVLIDLSYFEEALDTIEFVESAYSKYITPYVIYSKFRALCFLGRYDEANEIYTDNKAIFIENYPKIDLFETVYDKIKNCHLEKDIPARYLYNQIVDYSYEDFLNHITKHLAVYNTNDPSPNKAIFAPDFPLEDVLKELNSILPNEKRTNFSFIHNFYVIKYDNNGKIENKSTDYFRVITFHDTNNIITMYPMNKGHYLPHIDLNYLRKEEPPIVRKFSIVDKFNAKYGGFGKK